MITHERHPIGHAVTVKIGLVVVAAVALALPAVAANPHPSALVVTRADVPVRFRLDRESTGVRSNAAEIEKNPELAPLFRRWGRVTGYEIEFDRGAAKIEARADVFRARTGARQILDWYVLEVRKAGLLGLRRTRARLGDQGWVYSSAKHPSAVTIVVWRYDRVFSGVLGQGITADRTLELARAQQRRIATALR